MTPDPDQRISLMRAFAQSYRDRHFLPEHYDLTSGYLQTTLSDDSRMPLEFFLEYNNSWWFEIVTAVQVPSVGYDPDSDSGFIVLDIAYDTDVLRAMQHVHFGDGVINRIRTYASNTFFAGTRPLVQLDRYGNGFWLETATTCARRRSRPGSSWRRTPGNGLPHPTQPPGRSSGSGATSMTCWTAPGNPSPGRRTRPDPAPRVSAWRRWIGFARATSGPARAE
jgi:hypothetical protein